MRKIDSIRELRAGQFYLFFERLVSGKFGRRIVARFTRAIDKEKCSLTSFRKEQEQAVTVKFSNWEVYSITESQKEEFKKEA